MSDLADMMCQVLAASTWGSRKHRHDLCGGWTCLIHTRQRHVYTHDKCTPVAGLCVWMPPRMCSCERNNWHSTSCSANPGMKTNRRTHVTHESFFHAVPTRLDLKLSAGEVMGGHRCYHLLSRKGLDIENEQEGGIRKRKEAKLQSSVNKSCPEFPFSEHHHRSKHSVPKIAQQHLFRKVCCPHLPQKKGFKSF